MRGSRARHAGGDLLLAAPRQQVLRLLTLTCLIDVFSVHASVDEAAGDRSQRKTKRSRSLRSCGVSYARLPPARCGRCTLTPAAAPAFTGTYPGNPSREAPTRKRKPAQTSIAGEPVAEEQHIMPRQGAWLHLTLDRFGFS